MGTDILHHIIMHTEDYRPRGGEGGRRGRGGRGRREGVRGEGEGEVPMQCCFSEVLSTTTESG